METTLPAAVAWNDIEPRYRSLGQHGLTAQTVDSWLAEWSSVTATLDEMYRRLEVATTRNTRDTVAEQQYHAFLDDVYPYWQQAEQGLKDKLLASGLEPRGFGVQLRKMRADASLYREANVANLAENLKFAEQYAGITGGWTAMWNSEERPLGEVFPALLDPDRQTREDAWRAIQAPILRSTDAIAAVWSDMLANRTRIAQTADLPDFRAFRWQQLKRFDYTPQDCLEFHAAIREVVVPVVEQLYRERAARLGVDRLRPWDVRVDPESRPALTAFTSIDDLIEKSTAIFHHVDRELAEYFQIMQREDLLDLDTRLGKGQGGYCLPFNAVRRPFIFLSLFGTHGDVVGLLHEAGHAFHVFEMAHLPYVSQRDIETIGAEFAEVGSTAMELLASPYFTQQYGGYYQDDADAARAVSETLEGYLVGWCWISIIDALQHWIYEHPQDAASAEVVGRQYRSLVAQYFPTVDWTGLEQQATYGWMTIPHIFQDPLYYVEYGFAQLGALQIWGLALRDQADAVARYRRALSFGDTLSIPELFAVAGGKFGFDTGTVRPAVDLIVNQMTVLERRQHT